MIEGTTVVAGPRNTPQPPTKGFPKRTLAYRMLHYRTPIILVCATLLWSGACFTPIITTARACPFCSAVSQTLRQEMEVMDAVVIATAVQGDLTRDKDSGQVLMKIEKVLKGSKLVKEGQEVRAIYYGDVTKGRRFMMSGVDPPELQWSCLPLTERGEAYVEKVMAISDDPIERLRFYHKYLQDEEEMLSRDAYDEFAITPYDVVKQLAPEMDHDQLLRWINDPEMPTDRKRLYLTMIGVCGGEQDLPFLETLLRSSQKSTRGALDALIACYLTLAGEQGIPLIDELFLANKQAPYADTYAAIMAVRFHGTEGNVIARSKLVDSLHHVLDRKDLADLVIPDLARWSDWSQIDRLTELFIQADDDNNWVRVPVVNYLRACPKPEAKAALEKLEKIDPDAVKRANTFFSIPVPARDTGNKESSVERETDELSAIAGIVAKPGQPTAALIPPRKGPIARVSVADPLNPWRLANVLALALATIMIAQFLLLSGGSQPANR